MSTRDVDGVVPIPGRDLLRHGRECYWVTGTVAGPVRELSADRTSVFQEFLLVAGDARLICRTTRRRRDRLDLGDRFTLACFFEFVSGSDWSVFDLPDHWDADWRLQQISPPEGRSAFVDLVLDLEPVRRDLAPVTAG